MTAMELASQLVELTQHIGDLKMRVEVAEAKLSGAEERCKLILEAKNFWMERALAAEKRPSGWISGE